MEERFVYRKPPIGRSAAAVVLDGDVRVEHPLLKAPLVIPMGNVASVVRVTELDPDQMILRRDVRVLDLLSSALTDSNVVVVLKAPVRVPRFKYGAENGLPITSRERKHGLDLDALGVTVEEPDQLTAALRRRGVRLAATVASALREVVGEATPEQAVRRREERERDRSKARRWLVVFGLVWTTALAARFALGADGATLPASTIVGIMLSSLAWAALVALATVSFGGPVRGRRPVRDRASGWHVLGFLAGIGAMIVVPVVVAGGLASHLGTPRALAYGLVAGVPGGLICGMGLRATRRV